MKSRSGGVWDMYHAARPSSRRNLNVALERLVGKPNLVAKRAILANAIVAQMLLTAPSREAAPSRCA